MNNLNKFTEFLKSVDLAGYRQKYRPIKIVEMDLPKEIQTIALLYKVYWEEKKFIPFDEFYERYHKEKKVLLETFRIKIMMCDKCFYLGLPARRAPPSSATYSLEREIAIWIRSAAIGPTIIITSAATGLPPSSSSLLFPKIAAHCAICAR